MGLSLKSLRVMEQVPKALTTRESPRGLEYIAMVFYAVLDILHVRDLVSLAAAFIILFAAADEAVRGPLATPAPDFSLEEKDPVLVEVGATAIRVSDARAQAVLEDVPPADRLPLSALFASGLVDTAADQVALAKAAEGAGIAESLEIKAELALARRKILSSAYLDLAVDRKVTDAAVQARYEQLVSDAAGDERMDLQRLLLGTQAEAEEFRNKILRGASMARLVTRFSLDESTKEQGGHLPDVHYKSLPTFMKEAVGPLRPGDVSAPIKAEEGWYLVRVEARSAVFMPPFEVIGPRIRQVLRDEVIAETVDQARSLVPIRTTLREDKPVDDQAVRGAGGGVVGTTTTIAAAGPLSTSW